MSTCFITGISGQDGSFLAEQLREEGKQVVGILRKGRMSQGRPIPGISYVEWDYLDIEMLSRLLDEHKPEEFYNFAAFSTGAGMFDDATAIGELNGVAVARMLQAIVESNLSIRFCQASSSEMFGDPVTSPQNELTPFKPLSPYGAAKLFAHTTIGAYRERKGIFACSAILYNHESPRRRPTFVTRKIADAVARIYMGRQDNLMLGNLEARRDWGYAPEYVRAMRLMLAQPKADDYVIATGTSHSVREFCEIAFAHVGLDYRDWVKENTSDARQDTRGPLVGDSRKARDKLGWRQEKGFADLVRLMVDASINAMKSEDKEA